MGERPDRHGGDADSHAQQRPGGLGDFLFNEFRNAVSDIRKTLIDEGWFGRRTGAADRGGQSPLGWEMERSTDDALSDLPAEDAAFWGSHGRRTSFEEGWAARAPGDGPERPAKGDHDFDR